MCLIPNHLEINIITLKTIYLIHMLSQNTIPASHVHCMLGPETSEPVCWTWLQACRGWNVRGRWQDGPYVASWHPCVTQHVVVFSMYFYLSSISDFFFISLLMLSKITYIISTASWFLVIALSFLCPYVCFLSINQFGFFISQILLCLYWIFKLVVILVGWFLTLSSNLVVPPGFIPNGHWFDSLGH